MRGQRVDRKKEKKKYNEENKEAIAKQSKKHLQSKAPIEQVQKLKLYDSIKENSNQCKCKYCGEWYTPTYQEVYNRLRAINGTGGSYIYCSEECKDACPVYNQMSTPKGTQSANSNEALNSFVRQETFKRDNYTCQHCNYHKSKLSVPLHCHHIIPKSSSPIEAQDIDNLITLCETCHKAIHKIPGCSYGELKCASTFIKYLG